MPDSTDRSNSSGPKTTWQPSARNLSSRSFRGSFTAPADTAPTSTATPVASRGRFAVAMLLVIVAIGAGWIWRQPPEPTAPPAHSAAAVVELVRGPVLRIDPVQEGRSSTGSAFRGLRLDSGSQLDTTRVETRRSPARVSARLIDGPSLRLDAGSRARLISPTQIELERGAVYIDSEGDADAIEVRTTFGVVRDIGTQFEVRLIDGDDVGGTAAAAVSLVVRVREGEVRLTTPGGREHPAAAGEALTVETGGAVERGTTPIHGAAWQWVLETAAVPDIEGQPLDVFLTWLMREGGWTLHYADAATRARVAETSLHGTIEGLNAEEAMPMVLEGSGLAFTIVDGRFVLRSGDDP